MKSRAFFVLAALVLLGLAPAAFAQNNLCDQPGESPDVILGGIIDLHRYGRDAGLGITGYSFGTESCNIGTCWAEWFSGSPGLHPVIGQNLFRLKDGRFEHIGQSFLKHSFATLNNNLCGSCNNADGQHLGVNCSDPYTWSLNGSQTGLGPKFEVNAQEGTHLHPYTFQGQQGNTIYKRLQVKDADIDPDLNTGALYFVEGQYVTHDELPGDRFNNVSWRRLNVSESSPNVFNVSFNGPTIQQSAGLEAWAAFDTGVQVKSLDKLYMAASKVTDLGGGNWHYEYAVQNVMSHNGVQSFELPIPHGAVITNIGFHDVDYHSGEPQDGTDWAVTIDTSSSPNKIIWATQTEAQNPNANALLWGTMYNFRFDMNFAPVDNQLASLAPWRSDPPASNFKWFTQAPNRCGDLFCDFDENAVGCAIDCAAGVDSGDVENTLTVDLELNGDLTLEWDFSCLGGDSDYEVYEGMIGDFYSHTSKECTTFGLTNITVTPDTGNRYYLVVPGNEGREGSYGQGSLGERPQGSSPCAIQQTGTCPPA